MKSRPCGLSPSYAGCEDRKTYLVSWRRTWYVEECEREVVGRWRRSWSGRCHAVRKIVSNVSQPSQQNLASLWWTANARNFSHRFSHGIPSPWSTFSWQARVNVTTYLGPEGSSGGFPGIAPVTPLYLWAVVNPNTRQATQQAPLVAATMSSLDCQG